MTKTKSLDVNDTSDKGLIPFDSLDDSATPTTASMPTPAKLGTPSSSDPHPISQYNFYSHNPAFRDAVDRDQRALEAFRATRVSARLSRESVLTGEGLRRIRKELVGFATSPHPAVSNINVTYAPIGGEIENILGSIAGPPGTPYEGGLFYVRMSLADAYPRFPPQVHMLTSIYHPNISDEGRVCLDILEDNWCAALTVEKVLLSLSSLLDDPYPGDASNEEAGSTYIHDREAYDRLARACTKELATGVLPTNHALTKNMPDYEGYQ